MSAGDGPLHVRVLTVNCGPASEYLERATVPEACESVVALAQELKPDVLLLQEFRWQPKSLLQNLPGGPEEWHAIKGDTEKSPVVLWRSETFDKQDIPLDKRGKLEDFLARSRTVELVPRKQPQLRFLVTSYHGEYNKGSEDKKKQQSRALIGAVGGVAKRQDAPALIGGDWNVTLVDHNSGMAVCSNSPTEWTAQLGLVGGYLPHERDCKKYNQPCIDFFCGVQPATTGAALLRIASVRAHAHVLHSHLFDHDPVYADVVLVGRALCKPGLPPGIEPSMKMPLAWLELLTKVHLEAVALNMGLGDGAISQSRRLAGLLHNTGAQYNHLPPEAKPVISVAAILLGKGAAQGGATGPSARPRFGTPPPQERQWARPASSDAPVPLVLGNAPISSALSTHAPLTAEQVQQRIAQLEAEIEQLRARLPTGGRDAEPVPSAAAAAAPPVGSRSTEPVTSNASAAPPVAAAAPATSAAAGQLGRDTASSTRRRRLLARLWRAPSSNVPQRRLQQLSDGDMSMLCRYGLKKHVRTQLEHGTSIKVLSLTYADFTKAGLRLLCAQDGLQMTLKTTKPELVKKLKEQDAAKEGVVTSA